MRLNATLDEERDGINVAEHVRAFPEGSTRFDDLYGLRDDAESLNNQLKDDLPGRRLRTCNPAENLTDLGEWMLIRNNHARMAYRRRRAIEPLARTG